MRQIPTLKQRKFAAALIGPARGNQTVAARMAGYRGNDRQLAVQGSVNVRNLKIQQMIAEKLDAMVEPSLTRVAEGLDATKQRAFLTDTGRIVYSDPEPDHRVRTTTARLVLDLRQRLSNLSADADVMQLNEDGAKRQIEVADDATTEGRSALGMDVAQLCPADRVLFEEASEIEAELAEIERVDEGGDNGDH